MLICGMHKQQRQQQTKQRQFKTSSIVHKSTCLRQLGSSLQVGLMSYFQENTFVCFVHSGLIFCNKHGVLQLPAPYITMCHFLTQFANSKT